MTPYQGNYMSKKRINKPITVTLTPESLEAIEVLCEELDSKKVSPVVDTAIKEAMKSRGYTLKDKDMLAEPTNPISVEIIRKGKTLTKYAHNGENFICAPRSGNYIIRLRNTSYNRKLVVISVDGRNVMDGESAGYSGGGYVLNGYQTFDLKGWRRTDQEVAAFEFTDASGSYDVKVGGSGANLGVIGVAVFDEKELQHWHWNRPTWVAPQKNWWDDEFVITCNDGNEMIGGSVTESQTLGSKGIPISANSLSSDDGVRLNSEIRRLRGRTKSFGRELKRESTVGTGYGKKTAMHTVETTFNKASETPSHVVVLRYATRTTLKKWGVIHEPIVPAVNPFPEEKASVKAPPGWKG
jgi:hypothetical protein